MGPARTIDQRNALVDRRGLWPTAVHGWITNSSAFDSIVVLGLAESRNQPCACTSSPAENGTPSAPGLLETKAFQSILIAPLHEPAVPLPVWTGVRCVGDLTHTKLELVPHGAALRPLRP